MFKYHYICIILCLFIIYLTKTQFFENCHFLNIENMTKICKFTKKYDILKENMTLNVI